jgi:hypothetical protein
MASRLLILLLLTGGCGDAPLLVLKVVTPEGPDPLAGVEQLRLVVSNPPAEQRIRLEDPEQIDLELELEVASAVGSITLEGHAGSSLRARGETPPMVLRPEAGELALLVAEAGKLSRLGQDLPWAGRSMVSILIPAAGVLLAGGASASGEPVASVVLYDFFHHEVRALDPLPEPRAGAVGAICGSDCGIVALGEDESGLASRILRYDGLSWSAYDDGLSPAERREAAAIAPLSDGTYLIAGGRGPSGPLDTLLLLRPGDAVQPPALEVLPSRARAARERAAITASSGADAVLVAGGQAPGEAEAELIYGSSLTAHALELPGADLIGDTAAVALEDGRMVLVGGRDDSGAVLRDAWVIDPATMKVTHLPDLLGVGRAEHRVARVGTHLVVLGGVTESGELTSDAEMLGTDQGLARLRQIPMQSPRVSFSAVHTGPGSFILAGGEAGGQGVETLEVYQTSVPLP